MLTTGDGHGMIWPTEKDRYKDWNKGDQKHNNNDDDDDDDDKKWCMAF